MPTSLSTTGTGRLAGLAAAVLAVLIPLGLAPLTESRASTGQPGRGADRVAFLVLVPSARDEGFDRSLLRAFERIPGLSPGLYSATQGSYSREQSLLDISQGARVSRSLYDPEATPAVSLDRRGRLLGWRAILERASTAPQTIEPGLLAGSIPGGASLIRTSRDPDQDAIPAADRSGGVAGVETSDPDRIARSALAAGRGRDLVVVTTPPGQAGIEVLERLVRGAGSEALMIATQSPPDQPDLPSFPVAVSGLGAGSPTSPTTSLDGMVAAIDFAPTVLDHLGLPIPDEMTGTVIEEGPGRTATRLISLRDRLDSLGERRLAVIGGLPVAWLLLYLLAGAIAGAGRVRAAIRRTGGLAILWLPTVTLLAPLLGNPSSPVEIGLVAVVSLLLGAGSDRLVPWPRATAVPALFGLSAFTLDLILGSPLVIRSVLGPSPGYGARFYGIGNELEAVLVVLFLIGMAGLLTSKPKSWSAAGAVGAAAVALAVVLGSGRLGAAVGGVVVVAVGAGVMAVMLMPGRLTPIRIGALIAAPVVALLLLAGLDLLFSGDQGHFARNILGEGSGSGLGEAIERRLKLAWQQVGRGAMPVALLASLLAIAFGWKNRGALEPLPGPAWSAAIAGGLTAGAIGSLVEDSGPLLLVSAVLVLLGAVYYLLGRPDRAESDPGVEKTSVTG
jgi:hypothetical protein